MPTAGGCPFGRARLPFMQWLDYSSCRRAYEWQWGRPRREVVWTCAARECQRNCVNDPFSFSLAPCPRITIEISLRAVGESLMGMVDFFAACMIAKYRTLRRG